MEGDESIQDSVPPKNKKYVWNSHDKSHKTLNNLFVTLWCIMNILFNKLNWKKNKILVYADLVNLIMKLSYF